MPPSSSFIFIRSGAAIMSAMGQPASMFARSTVLSGHSMEAVSAIKCTPQKTISLLSDLAASWESPRESPTKSAMSWISGTQ